MRTWNTRAWASLIIVLAVVMLPAIALTAPRAYPPEPPTERTPVPGGHDDIPDSHKLTNLKPVPADKWAIQGAATPCVNGMAGTYPCKGIDLMSRVPLSAMSSSATVASSIWGYTDLDDNREYAVIGLNTGTGVVDITDPVNPRVVGFITGVNSNWREVKTYQVRNQATGKWDGYAYISTEGSGAGVQIIDLTKLPDSISLAGTWRGVSTSHTVMMGNIDWFTSVANEPDLTPLLLINGSNKNGLRILSIANPRSPVQLGAWENNYVHDIYFHVFRDGRTAGCVSARNPCEIVFNYSGGGNGLQILDITDRSRPTQIGQLKYPNMRFTHSGWISKNNNRLFLMDELDEQGLGTNTLVRTVNITNLRSPTISGGWTGPGKAVEHNGYTIGDKYYMSHYSRGTVILDVTNPDAPREHAYFDSRPESNGSDFSGPWGIFPFFRSGTIIASDIQRGLIVMRESGVKPPTVTPTPPTTTPTTPTPGFSDDFETNKGWTTNPNGTDTATVGRWERGDPEATDYNGPKQLGTTTSGVNALVTGRLAGSGVGDYDLDGGVSSIRSPSISVTGSNPTLTLRYYLAHASNSSSDDYFRVKIGGTTVFERRGSATDVDASWQTATINLSSYAGQTIQIVIEAADTGTGSLLEAAVDDVAIN